MHLAQVFVFCEFTIAIRATYWVTQTILIIYAALISAYDSFTFVVAEK
jgi:hypothetical protein